MAPIQIEPSYRRRLAAYRYGPGVFKLDLALEAPVPWRAEPCRRAGTVHLGGTLEEIAAAEREVAAGRHAERPFVLVAQPSLFDPARAPEGRHTLWAYCHVPNGSADDRSASVLDQIERFAPGFRGRVLAMRRWTTADLEAHDPNLVGGDIGGGANDLRQVIGRPVLRWDPYEIPVRGAGPRVFLCSSATPPGGGVHGMCGAGAARSALRALRRG